MNRMRVVVFNNEGKADEGKEVPAVVATWFTKGRSMKRGLAALLLTLCVASQSWAQSTGTPAPAPTSPPVAGTAVLGVMVAESIAVAVGYRASKFIGASVYNDKNEKIGRIGDLIIKPDGTLSYAIVDVGGFLGIGQHQVAIPVGQFTAVKPKIVLPGATKDALKALPEFNYSKS